MKKFLALILALVMALSLVACGEKKDDTKTEGDTATGSVYYLNFKPESEDAWQALAKTYTAETGVPVKVVTAASGEYETMLVSEMDKDGAPTLFQCNEGGVATWGDFCYDLSSTDVYNELVSKDYALKNANGEVISIAYCLETYGIIVNKALLEQAGLCCSLFHLAAVLTQFLILVPSYTSSTLGIASQQTVNHQVGITSDGTCKMGVVAEGQTIVSHILYAVLGFHHGTQAHHLHHVLFLLAFDIVEQLVEIAAYVVFGAVGAQLIAELAHEIGQIHQLLWVRCVVDTIHKDLGLGPLAYPANAFGHGAVGQEHELLHQFVGILGHLEVYTCGFTFLVGLKAYLTSVKINGSAGEALPPQLLGHAVQCDKLLGKMLGRFCIGRERCHMVARVVIVLLAGFVMSKNSNIDYFHVIVLPLLPRRA